MEPVPSEHDGVVVGALSPHPGPSPVLIFGCWGPHWPGSADAAGRDGAVASAADVADVLVAQATFAPGATSPLIRHSCEEVVLVLHGQGAVRVDGDIDVPLSTGDLALIRAGAWHGMVAGDAG